MKRILVLIALLFLIVPATACPVAIASYSYAPCAPPVSIYASYAPVPVLIQPAPVYYSVPSFTYSFAPSYGLSYAPSFAPSYGYGVSRSFASSYGRSFVPRQRFFAPSYGVGGASFAQSGRAAALAQSDFGGGRAAAASISGRGRGADVSAAAANGGQVEITRGLFRTRVKVR